MSVACLSVLSTVYGDEPDLTREGGSIPVTLTFEQLTGKSVMLLPIGACDDGAHSQNEKINRSNYIKGVCFLSTWCTIFWTACILSLLHWQLVSSQKGCLVGKTYFGSRQRETWAEWYFVNWKLKLLLYSVNWSVLKSNFRRWNELEVNWNKQHI